MPCRTPNGPHDAAVVHNFPSSFPPDFPLDTDYVDLALAEISREYGVEIGFDDLLPFERTRVLRRAQELKASSRQPSAISPRQNPTTSGAGSPLTKGETLLSTFSGPAPEQGNLVSHDVGEAARAEARTPVWIRVRDWIKAGLARCRKPKWTSLP